MREPLSNRSRTGRISKAFAIKASTKGWLANQAISDMDPMGAVRLENWFPQPDSLQLRNGSLSWATTPEVVPVKTLLTYVNGLTSNIFAAVNGKIYDVSAGGAISSPIATGFTSDYWQYITMATSGGLFLVAFNGNDPPQFYNGATWAALTPAITGPASANALIQPWNFKQRMWFIEANTTTAWFLTNVQAIGGAAQAFPIGSLLSMGGYLMAGGTWTHDAGFGPTDYIAFVSSEGEVILYSGTDPTGTGNFAMVGRFVVGRPIGRRCLLRSGPDLVINCSDGVMPLSQAIAYDRASAATRAFTWNIQDAFNDAYVTYGTTQGWEIMAYPKGHMAIINIPTALGVSSVQYVMNTLTGAWCKFSGLSAITWAIRQDDCYFGGPKGNVFIFDRGSADWNGTAYQSINATWISAFSNLGAKGVKKICYMARPIFVAPPPIAAGIGVCADFNLNPAIASQQSAFSNLPLWDVALWDQAQWPLDNPTQANWQKVTGFGYQIAASIGLNSLPPVPSIPQIVKFTEMNILYEQGGYI